MSPEVLRCPDKSQPTDHKDRVDLGYNEKADVWAVGVLAYEMLTGSPPFKGSDKHAQQQAVFTQTPSIPHWLSDLSASFIRHCLSKDYTLRPTAA